MFSTPKGEAGAAFTVKSIRRYEPRLPPLATCVPVSDPPVPVGLEGGWLSSEYGVIVQSALLNVPSVLGKELRKARLAAGLTQEQVASKARMSREYVSELERNQYSPILDMLLRICGAIGTPLWTIVRRIESATRQGDDSKGRTKSG